MPNAEREFYRLLAELASDGLFVGHDGVAERIADAFEAAMAEARNALEDAHGPEQQQHDRGPIDRDCHAVGHGAAALGVQPNHKCQ